VNLKLVSLSEMKENQEIIGFAKQNNMKLIFIFIFFSKISLAQLILTSGYYDELKIAYNPETKRVTGYFESYTGVNASFSCVFYIDGILLNNEAKIKTYYPIDTIGDVIEGKLKILNSSTISILLPEEHGGCGNVQHFADSLVEFHLEKKIPWVEIRFVINDKAYFYSGKSESRKKKTYVVKGNILQVKRIEGEWAFCNYQGKNITQGWIKLIDLNK
jgi:hypothetical protein